MLQKLIQQFRQFSRENWWIYLIFLVAFLVVIYSGRGNIYEVVGVFSLNVLGNIYMLLMQDSFKDQKFKRGVIFLCIGNILYFLLALYSFFINGEFQYLLWQIGFQLAGLRTTLFFAYDFTLKFLNLYAMTFVSVLLVIIGAKYLGISGYGFFQSLGFALTVVGLSETSDIRRYFLIFLGIIVTAIASFFGIYINYFDGTIFGITVSFTILSLSSSMFYFKLLPLYISRLKNT